jgi:hypothetical protein
MGFDGITFLSRKQGAGQAEAQKYIANLIAMRRLVSAGDPSMTAEMIQNRVAEEAGELGGMGNTFPPAFLWYHHCGYKDRWDDPENNDPGMARSFSEYLKEAVECSSRRAGTCCGASAGARSSCSSTCGQSSR